MSKQDSRFIVVRNVFFFVFGLFVLPITLGFLVGDSASTLGFIVAISGPLFLFAFMLYCTKDDPHALGYEEFWVGLWVLAVYFVSMFLTWYHSTDQVFLLEYTEKIRGALIR